MAAVGVIGSGAWGTTLAILLANEGAQVMLWEHRPERAVEIQQRRENSLFLPGFRFPDSLQVTSDIAQAVKGADILLLVTPSQRMRENVRLLAPYVGGDTLCVSCSKGIEISSLKRMTEVIQQEIPALSNRIAALTSHGRSSCSTRSTTAEFWNWPGIFPAWAASRIPTRRRRPIPSSAARP